MRRGRSSLTPSINWQSPYARGLKCLLHADAGFIDLASPARTITPLAITLGVGARGRQFSMPSGSVKAEIALSPEITVSSGWTIAAHSDMDTSKLALYDPLASNGTATIYHGIMQSSTSLCVYAGGYTAVATLAAADRWTGYAITGKSGGGKGFKDGAVGSTHAQNISANVAVLLGDQTYAGDYWVDTRWIAVWDRVLPDSMLRHVTAPDGSGVELLLRSPSRVYFVPAAVGGAPYYSGLSLLGVGA